MTFGVELFVLCKTAGSWESDPSIIEYLSSMPYLAPISYSHVYLEEEPWNSSSLRTRIFGVS